MPELNTSVIAITPSSSNSSASSTSSSSSSSSSTSSSSSVNIPGSSSAPPPPPQVITTQLLQQPPLATTPTITSTVLTNKTNSLNNGNCNGNCSVVPQVTEKPTHYTYLKEFRVEQCTLFLQHKCTQHRPYTCFYWHFKNQRRRKPIRKRDGTFNYNPDVYCDKYDEQTGLCPNGDDCQFVHRNAGDTEKRYHLRYYKTATCIHETDTKGNCTKNGAHCAFAHGQSDLRPPVYDIRELQGNDLVNERTINLSSSLEKERLLNEDPKWNDTNYVLINYKTEPCKRPPRLCRQGFACPQYHNARDRRRNPSIYKYRSTPCPNVKQGDDWLEPTVCENGDNCKYCHSRTEQQFHPEIYKSSKCNDMVSTGYCPRGPFCAFAHLDHELKTQRTHSTSESSDLTLENYLTNALPGKDTGDTDNKQDLDTQHDIVINEVELDVQQQSLTTVNGSSSSSGSGSTTTTTTVGVMAPPPGVNIQPTAAQAALILNSNQNLMNLAYNRPIGSEREDYHNKNKQKLASTPLDDSLLVAALGAPPDHQQQQMSITSTSSSSSGGGGGGGGGSKAAIGSQLAKQQQLSTSANPQNANTQRLLNAQNVNTHQQAQQSNLGNQVGQQQHTPTSKYSSLFSDPVDSILASNLANNFDFNGGSFIDKDINSESIGLAASMHTQGLHHHVHHAHITSNLIGSSNLPIQMQSYGQVPPQQQQQQSQTADFNYINTANTLLSQQINKTNIDAFVIKPPNSGQQQQQNKKQFPQQQQQQPSPMYYDSVFNTNSNDLNSNRYRQWIDELKNESNEWQSKFVLTERELAQEMQKVDALKKRLELLENQQLVFNNNGYINLKYFSSNSPNNSNSNQAIMIKTLLPSDNELSKSTVDILQSVYVLFKNDLNKLDKVLIDKKAPATR